MLKKIFPIVFWLVRYTGVAGLIRLLFSRNRISMVLYHNPEPDFFEKHLQHLSSHYNLITLDDLRKVLRDGNMEGIPRYALLITFDDGWKENFNLLPLFKKYGVRPVIFLTSHIICTDRHFWWTHCEEKDLNALKVLPNQQRLHMLAQNHGYTPENEYRGQRQALNREEIRSLAPWVDFGLHTCFHPVLTKCTRHEKEAEISECRAKVENLLDHEVDILAYPNGDYDEECIEVLKESGVKMARSIDAGWNNAAADSYRLKVTGVSDDASITKLITELSGISMYIQYLVYGSLSGRKNKI